MQLAVSDRLLRLRIVATLAYSGADYWLEPRMTATTNNTATRTNTRPLEARTAVDATPCFPVTVEPSD